MTRNAPGWLALAALAGATLLPLAVLGGCDGPADNGPPPAKVSEQTFEDQIAKVNADPNLTPEAKRNAIAGIEMAKRMREAGGQGYDQAGKASQSR